jgi:hypothetical protein
VDGLLNRLSQVQRIADLEDRLGDHLATATALPPWTDTHPVSAISGRRKHAHRLAARAWPSDACHVHRKEPTLINYGASVDGGVLRRSIAPTAAHTDERSGRSVSGFN